MKGWIKVILLSFGIFFIIVSLVFFLAGLSPTIRLDYLAEGLVILLFGIAPIAVVIYMEKKDATRPLNVTQEINIDGKDLVGGKRNAMDIKCRGCGAPLSSADIRITDMGVLIKCPFCGKAYVMEEEPKW